MRKMFVEEIESHIAFNPKKYCTCGEHQFDMVKQLDPPTIYCWSIRCPYCGRETGQYMMKDAAMAEWKRGLSDEKVLRKEAYCDRSDPMGGY